MIMQKPKNNSKEQERILFLSFCGIIAGLLAENDLILIIFGIPFLALFFYYFFYS
jgi:hypothetical protein